MPADAQCASAIWAGAVLIVWKPANPGWAPLAALQISCRARPIQLDASTVALVVRFSLLNSYA